MITAWGICMAVAFAAAYWWSERRLGRIGVDQRTAANIGILALVGGLVGSRARYVWERPELFFPPGEPFAWSQVGSAANLNAGGMVWYGGVLFAVILILAYGRWRRLPLTACSDAILPPLLLGLGIGRIGCFLNGCCYGLPSTLPWACAAGPGPVLRHPTQLYESLACVLLAGSVAWWQARRPRPLGLATLFCVVGYAAWRFFDEALRDRGPLVESHRFGLAMTSSQATSVDMALIAVLAAVLVAWWRRRRAPNAMPG